MGHILSSPVASKMVRTCGTDDFRVGAAEMQGYRVDMEDTMTIRPVLSAKHNATSFFGVYDGHGGDKASEFCESSMHKCVAECENPNNVQELTKAVEAADKKFLESYDEEERNHGSTSVFALVTKSNSGAYQVTVSNVGDSRCMIIRSDGKVEELTVDHKPETKEEQDRIVSAGGHVSANRVDGQLAMSRAIGDWNYKGNGELTFNLQKVIPTPDITKAECKAGDLMLLCCDGIVEQMTGQEAGSYVYKQYKLLKDPAKVVCKLLDFSLFDKGSKDNHSAMLVCFEKGNDYPTRSEFVPGPYHAFSESGDFTKAYWTDAMKHGVTEDKKEQILKQAQEIEQQLGDKIKTATPQANPLANVFNVLLRQNMASQLATEEGEE